MAQKSLLLILYTAACVCYSDLLAKQDHTSLTIASECPIFDNIRPAFTLSEEKPWEKFWWQVSADLEFAVILPNSNHIQDFEKIFTLPDDSEMFLDSGRNYYIRAKAYCKGSWSEWSVPHEFLIIKPLSNLKAHYVKSPYVSQEIWDRVQPYLLPENHPAKAALDKIFGSSRALLSTTSMRRAGFVNPKPQEKGIVVTRHAKLKGYVVKAYLDDRDIMEWALFIQRAAGARVIQSLIDKYHYHDRFKVPKKWIYPLPVEPSPPLEEKYFRKNFILLVEDMNILTEDANKYKYRKDITPKILDALYTVIKEGRLVDSVYIDNIPFANDGRIAFVDTEHYNCTTQLIKYQRLTPNFSTKMQEYWKQIINQ